MALPVLNAAKYKTIVPSLGKEVEYRPYLVKEEKILMIAMESQDQQQILGAIKDVISSCVYDDLNVNQLTMFDLEALFLKLRSKSVGESTEVKAKCEECDHEHKELIRFDDIKMPVMDSGNTTIKLTAEVGLTLSYPKVGDIGKHQSDKLESLDGIMEVLIDCIESIYDADNVYPARDSKREELKDFIDSLNSDQFTKLTSYFETIPALKYELEYKCEECGHDNKIVLSGLQSFFG